MKFWALNITTQLIGQVYEIKVNIPSEPVNLSYITNTKSIHFEKPKFDGGSRIQQYEIHIKTEKTDIWYLYQTVNVKTLSSDPQIPENIFGRLGGTFTLRDYAQMLV